MTVHYEFMRRVRLSLVCDECNVTESQVVDVTDNDDVVVVRRTVLMRHSWDRPWAMSPIQNFQTDMATVCSPECLDKQMDRARGAAYPQPSGV